MEKEILPERLDTLNYNKDNLDDIGMLSKAHVLS